MEKISRTLLSKKKKQKLPQISINKSSKILTTRAPETLITPPQHLQQLRKLYYQYKSNANILTHSPYYTNRHQQQHVVSYINANKNQLSAEQIEHIEKRYTVDETMVNKNKHLADSELKISLHCFQVKLQMRIKVKTVEQLEILLKKEFAIQQIKSYGELKKVQQIGGFNSVKPSSHLDFVFSQKDNVVPSGTYQLQPWFLEDFQGTVQLKDFRFIRCLGSGGFSLVYLARDKLKGNFHALKLIDKAFILESERQMIVENQRYVLGELLQSPFVTPLRFCFETKNHFVFAIQFCPGGELFYQLKKVKRMTEQQAKFYFLQILIGLDHLHSKNIIYRDLKPENLLIGSDGHIRIADFGLAKPLMGRPAAYSFCGSPEYMAPEMLKKSGHGITIDYYCLGALLYQLVVGVPPYYSLNHEQIYHCVLNQQLSFPSHTPLSGQIKSLLAGLLEKDPSRRLGSLYGLKQILIHPWIGRINKKQIQNKQLKPPFLPDLNNFNFDQSELDERSKETSKKINQDMRCYSFETHFNEQFYFANSEYLPAPRMKTMKSKRSLKVRSLDKGRAGNSTRRMASDRGKSK